MPQSRFRIGPVVVHPQSERERVVPSEKFPVVVRCYIHGIFYGRSERRWNFYGILGHLYLLDSRVQKFVGWYARGCGASGQKKRYGYAQQYVVQILHCSDFFSGSDI